MTGRGPLTGIDLDQALQDLRGYRMPAPVDWWPPAPGWWLLAAFAVVTLVAGYLWIRRRSRRLAAVRRAEQELLRLHRRWRASGDTAAFVRGLSMLLRRFVLTRYPRDDVAALTGDDWLHFLDAHGGDGRFVDGPGRHLAVAPYAARPDVPADELADLVGRWIRRNRRAQG